MLLFKPKRAKRDFLAPITHNNRIAILFGRTLPKVKQLHLNNYPISWSQNVKYFGVILDRKLSFSSHASNIIKEANIIREMFYPVLNRKSPTLISSKISIFKMYIQPILS